MSDYKRALVFIFLLVIIAIAIVYVGFSMNSLDNSMAEISDNISNGDKEYNDAVNLINNKNYDEALEKHFMQVMILIKVPEICQIYRMVVIILMKFIKNT